jgi:DNA-binding HxlR family transcriptional regulator
MLAMQRKTYSDMPCPIARSLEHVGDWWNILILRDAFHGFKRFDEFQDSLGIASNTLTRRLTDLVEAGLLEKRRYNDRPPRFEYVLTKRGLDFRPVLLTLYAWGNRHFAPEGPSVVLQDLKTGANVEPIVIDQMTGQKIDHTIRAVPGPAASDRVRARYQRNNTI